MSDLKQAVMEGAKAPELERVVSGVSRGSNGALPDPEMEGLSLYEKKALLVNRELDSHGMGKYQVRGPDESSPLYINNDSEESGTFSSCAASAISSTYSTPTLLVLRLRRFSRN